MVTFLLKIIFINFTTILILKIASEICYGRQRTQMLYMDLDGWMDPVRINFFYVVIFFYFI